MNAKRTRLSNKAKHKEGAQLRHRSQKQKDEILEIYVSLVKSGSLTLDASKAAGASLSSINRWLANRKIEQRPPSSKWASLTSIDIAIDILSSGCQPRLNFLEALFKFIAWLRWPNQPKQHPSAITSCIIAYFMQTTDAVTLADLFEEDRNMLARHLRLDVLKQFYSENYLDMPLFTDHCIDDQPYDSFDAIADIVRFMLAYEARDKLEKDKATLEKAHLCLAYGIYKYKWWLSKAAFWKFWMENGPTAPFHYIRSYDFARDLIPDPSQEDFSKKVKYCEQHPGELEKYLSHSRWAVEALKTRLSDRSNRSVHFPQFPTALAVLPLAPLPLSPLIHDVLKNGKFPNYEDTSEG